MKEPAMNPGFSGGAARSPLPGSGEGGGVHGPAGRRAVFLDRDGVINVSPGEGRFVLKWADFRFADGVEEALKKLKEAGLLLVVVTNQSGVGRGLMTEADLMEINIRMADRLAGRGASLDGVYYCPHHPEGVVAAYARACACRKPQPGLIHRASADLGLDLRRSWVVGDAPSDVLAGRAAGCQTALLTTRGESQRDAVPTCAADSLLEAARIIVSADEAKPLPGRSA